MPSQEKILASRLYVEIIDHGQFEKLGGILSPEMVWHDPLLPTGEVRGIESFKSVLAMFRSAFPDLHVVVDDQIKESDKVATRSTITEAHKGGLVGIPATGKQMRISGISILRFEHGKAVEEWIEEDGLGLMRQLGVAK